MEISYDKEADAIYIEFSKRPFAKNKKVDDLTIFDLDKKGEIIGIEILEASKRLPNKSLQEIHVRNIDVVND